MLKFQEFFTGCTGRWTTERVYHSVLDGKVEKSYTEFQVDPITEGQKQQILSLCALSGFKVEGTNTKEPEVALPGFAIAFDTRSEIGEKVSMSLKALFVPDAYVVLGGTSDRMPPSPMAARVDTSDSGEVIQGFYLRDEGYSETGAIAGRFTYQPTRQTLEMTTYYRRSVAVDQMRMVAPDLRLRTIVTYQRPIAVEPPSVIDLIGFGVERRQLA